jgi:hypothetical protein
MLYSIKVTSPAYKGEVGLNRLRLIVGLMPGLLKTCHVKWFDKKVVINGFVADASASGTVLVEVVADNYQDSIAVLHACEEMVNICPHSKGCNNGELHFRIVFLPASIGADV